MTNFLSLEEEYSSWDKSKVAILPIPYEATTSYGHGTKNAPQAIIDASTQVELFDEELEASPYRCGIHTMRPIEFGNSNGEDAISLIRDKVRRIVGEGKFPIGLGGEHTITSGMVDGVREKYPDIHIVHLDAHADMREEYEGTKWSHACVMRRLFEKKLTYTSIGVRSICEESFDVIKSNRENYFFAHEIYNSNDWIGKALSNINKPVYLTLDVDVFDASILPTTGTPEPGGLHWYQVTAFIKELMKNKQVVGADIVELAPDDKSRAYDFMIAKLCYKMIGYFSELRS